MVVRVHREDTDFSGIVYHASCLRVIERARTNFMRLLGVRQRSLWESTDGQGPPFAFVVRSMTLDYVKSARFDDLLTIATVAETVSGASMILRQTVERGEDLLVEAHVRIALVSGGRAKPFPKSLRHSLVALQEGPANVNEKVDARSEGR